MKPLPPSVNAVVDAGLLAKRLNELRRHANHLRELRPRVSGSDVLREDLSLHNNVLFSWLIVCQAMLDIAADFAASRSLRFRSSREVMEDLAGFPELPASLLNDLEWLPSLRDDFIHENSRLDQNRVVRAFDHLDSIEQLAEIVLRMQEGPDVGQVP